MGYLVGCYRLWTGHASSYWIKWAVNLKLRVQPQDAGFVYMQTGVTRGNTSRVTHSCWLVWNYATAFFDVIMCFGLNMLLDWIAFSGGPPSRIAPVCFLFRCSCIALVLLWYAMGTLQSLQTTLLFGATLKYSHTFEAFGLWTCFPWTCFGTESDSAAAAMIF